MKEIAKRQPKRPPRGFLKNKVGLPPKRPIAIRLLTDPKGKKIGNAIKKFKAGMVGVDALKKIGIPGRAIDQLIFERKLYT